MGRATVALMIGAVAGLLVRGRWRYWVSFALLLLFGSLHDGLVALWPDRFYRQDIWRAKESFVVLMRLAMVIELTARLFRRFPGALATARQLMVVILGSTFAAVVAIPVPETGHVGFVGHLMPRILNGTIWLFAAIAILILWYRLPVHWFQKAILLSYVPYLLVFTAALNALGDLGWQRAAWANRAGAAAYSVLVVYWFYTVWRPDPPPVRAPESSDVA